MEGKELLTRVKDTTPKMRELIIRPIHLCKTPLRALNKEANGYMSKPFEAKEALKAIREQLSLNLGASKSCQSFSRASKVESKIGRSKHMRKRKWSKCKCKTD
jgi:DNA-binding NtrC family response regulator